jgi:aldehyde:ferredoxin oxidoreductase
MAYGYNGNVLRVNLTTKTVHTETPGGDFYRHYCGGRGFIGYYLLKELAPHVDPLSPKNLLIFADGVLSGGPFGGSGRNAVGARSPLTGRFGEAEVGGFWGAELKHAGFDAIIISGRADKPVYLWVHDGQAEIRDAAHLWGQPTAEAQDQIQQELDDRHIRTALIGAGGENLVRYACIINDLRHAAGRSGMGAVMGSKNLKGIAVRGDAAPPLADPEGVQAIAKWLADGFREIPAMYGLHLQGTASGVLGLNTVGALPTRNFQRGVFEGAEAISGQKMTDTILTGRGTCYACPVRCKRIVTPQEPYGFDNRYGGPEYETIASFGSNCGISNLAALAKAHALCAAHSLDTISTGASIAFAMECFERGLLTAQDSSGMPLRFGDADAMLQAIEWIAQRQGLGRLLAEGTRRAAQQIGGDAPRYAMQVKGQELPLQDPRLAHLRGLGYVINPAGADHLAGAVDTFFEKEASPMLQTYRALGVLNPMSLRGYNVDKVRVYTYSHMWMSFSNCAILCMFIRYNFDQVTKLVQGVTGWNSSLWELMKIGERASSMAAAFNAREAYNAPDDGLPDRFYTPLQQAALAGVAIDRAALKEAKRWFYGMMGWDPQTGVPTRSKLDELGLSWVGECLEA